MKPKGWRKYYGYHPQTLDALGKLSDKAIARQEQDYREWLCDTRDWPLEDASAHIEKMPSAKVLHSEHEGESKVREEKHFAPSISVRTIRCHSTGAKQHYGWQTRPWRREPELDWHKLPVRSDAPTTYAVMWDGICVGRFLSKAKATALAQAIAEEECAA